MSEDMTKEQALDFFAEFYGGEHHIHQEVKKYGDGWCILHDLQLATFDTDGLTHLVLLAHEKAVRVGIEACNPRYMKISIHQRKRGGRMFERHPTLEEIIK